MALDPELIRELERFRLAVRRLATIPREGDRTSRRRGRSVDFVAHREYTPGDEPRTIDWAAYARLEELLVKTFARDEAATLDIVLDTSTSMGFGNPSKLSLAAKLAQVFGYLALSGHGRVQITLPGATPSVRTFEGKGKTMEMIEVLSSLAPAGRSDSLGALRTLRTAERGRGLVLLLGDLGCAPAEDDLRRARARFGHLVTVLVLAPEEMEPEFDGKVRLEDSESGQGLELHVDATARDEYRKRLGEFLARTEETAKWNEATFLLFRSDTPLQQAFFVTAREAGLVT